MVFKWNPVIMNCPSLYYIISSDCGLCRDNNIIINETTATCSATGLSREYCTFGVKTGVCNSSEHLQGATGMIQLITGTKVNC